MSKDTCRCIFSILITCILFITAVSGNNQEDMNLNQVDELEYDPYMYSQIKSVNISKPHFVQEAGTWIHLDGHFELWNPLEEDIFINVTNPNPDIVQPCGITFEVNSDTNYNFSKKYDDRSHYTPLCLIRENRTYEQSPALHKYSMSLRGFEPGVISESFKGNLSISLKFSNKSLIKQNPNFEQFYNLTAEIIDETITLQTDKIPDDWGTKNNTRGWQMRISSIDHYWIENDKLIWNIPIHMVSEIVGSGKVTTGCIERYPAHASATLIVNRSTNETRNFRDNIHRICSTLHTEHEIKAGIRYSNFEIEIDFNTSFIPPGVYTFSYGFGSPNVIKYTIEIQNDEYFTSYHSENQNIVYSEFIPSTSTMNESILQSKTIFLLIIPVIISNLRRRNIVITY